jgi:hypothetical protein
MPCGGSVVSSDSEKRIETTLLIYCLLLIGGFGTPLTPALAGGAREEHSGLLNHQAY